MITPRISLVAFEAQEKGKAFVKSPTEPGRYFLLPTCVVRNGCPQCGAIAGEPCISGLKDGQNKYWVSDVHYRRKDKYRSLRQQRGTNED